MPSNPPLNQILYGPPGTGKTYETINAALEILAPEYLAANIRNRKALKTRFDTLSDSGHIRFVTFHQSFSYEDFVEGLRATTDEDETLKYEVADGVFKLLCESAAVQVTEKAEAPLDLAGRTVWKMSLGNTLGSDAGIFEECIANGYALLGYGQTIDFTGARTRKDIYERFQAAGSTLSSDDYAVTAVTTFVLKMKVGDLIVVTDGNMKFRAIGQFTGEYKTLNRDAQGDDYGQCRTVKWLRIYKPSLPFDQLTAKQFSQMTVYQLYPGSLNIEKLATLLNTKSGQRKPFQEGESFGSGYVITKASQDVLELRKPKGNQLDIGMRMLGTLAEHVRRGQLTIEDIKEKRVFDKLPDTTLEPFIVNGYNNILPALVQRMVDGEAAPVDPLDQAATRDARVLIIDEINRGNVSRVFGDLITLIEPSKRSGNDEALEVTLPYSKNRFSVPANLHIIGTMNTADRSLASLDLALRRRFNFREMPPRPELLVEVDVAGVSVASILSVINARIEILLDRDHCIGHAYFMPLVDTPTLRELGAIFRTCILPLLQEYFFEDWQRIQWVLNDHRKSVATHRFIDKPVSKVSELFGDDVSFGDQNQRWIINEDAFFVREAYVGLIGDTGSES